MMATQLLPNLDEPLLFKFGKIGPHSAKLFSSSSAWFSSPRQLNDPFECRPFVAGLELLSMFGDFFVQDACSSDFAIYCVSRTVDNILLWSHYADEHKGYCLAFSEEALCGHFKTFGEVIYQDEYPQMKIEGTTHDEQAKAFLLTKYTAWSYEREVRFVEFGSGAGLRDYPANALRAVILGACMPSGEKAKVREWLSARPIMPTVFEAKLSTRRFGLEFTAKNQ